MSNVKCRKVIHLPEEIKIVPQEQNLARIEVFGAHPGYGLTLGNALRRVILSSLPGAAITYVQIKGVNHEFSSIPHVYENVIDILLNLKQVRLKSFSDEPVTIALKGKGEKDLRAKDFSKSSQIEIVTPDAPVATLTDKKADFSLEATVEKGLGFEPAERRDKEKLPIGTIALDATFTPVKKVAMNIENMRVGERTDFNRIVLDVETDGTVTPAEAFFASAKILSDQFKFIVNQKDADKKKKEIVSPTKKKIEELKLSTRTVNALQGAGIKSVGGLVKKTEDDLENLEGLGAKGVGEIKKLLKRMELELKE